MVRRGGAIGHDRSRRGIANTAVRRDASGSKDGVRLPAELHRSPVHEQYWARTSWVPVLVRHWPLSFLSVMYPQLRTTLTLPYTVTSRRKLMVLFKKKSIYLDIYRANLTLSLSLSVILFLTHAHRRIYH